MKLAGLTQEEQRVLVLAPTEADAVLTKTLLSEAGLHCCICKVLGELCHEVDVGSGAVLITEEVLVGDEAHSLVLALQRQPPWSDVPILLLTSRGADSPTAVWAMELLGNVTVLERPTRLTTLISGLRAALRARRRQYELRARVEMMKQQGDRLRLLWEAAAVLLTTEQPDAMMRGLFAKIASPLGLDAYFNFMVDESGQALRMESCTGIAESEKCAIERLNFGQAICGTVAVERIPIVASFIQQSDEPKARIVKGFGIRVYACNPLMAGDRLLGTLSFASREKDYFEPDELEFLQAICHYVAYAYERLRLIKQLREEDEKKDEFLATLAHELRNPLAPIRNAAQYFRLKGPPDPDFQNARDIIDRQVGQMTRLVDDLLDISRITRGKIVLQQAPVSLALVLANAVEASRPLIEEAGHQLVISLPPVNLSVSGDAMRLSQVFGNLLTNAAKYTDPGGRIELATGTNADEVFVSVVDSGIGIAPEHLPKVFDMFSQVDPALERSQGGLGIGLALVRNLISLHNGRVEARSKGLGLGSKFTVTLPLLPIRTTSTDDHSQGTSVRTLPTSVTAPPKPRRRILVADDNVDAAKSLTMLLSILGHEVCTAYDGLDAIELAGRFRPHIMLLDIGMPKLNGYDTARSIRQTGWGDDVLLVALTGWGQEEDKRRAADAGFDHHITKPVDPMALEKLLIADRNP